jgi:hypothetical protein
LTKEQRKKLPTETELRLERFRRSARKIDIDPQVDEYVNPKDPGYIYNIGYTQTAKPVLTATKPAEFTGKTGYYGKQGTYYMPTTTYRDHPVYHDMKQENSKFSYIKGMTYTNLAQEIVQQENDKWDENRELRVLSRNFTSLSNSELQERARYNLAKKKGFLTGLDPTNDIMSKDINPYDAAMRASAYNPFGKLLGNPNLKTPYRKHREYEAIVTANPNLTTSNTALRYDDQSFIGSRQSMKSGMMPTPNLTASRRSMPDLRNYTGNEYLEPPRNFHDLQTQKAMWQGIPGQKFTYAALNSEVENNYVQSKFPAVQPFHIRTARGKIPTTSMNSSFLPNTAGRSGFVTSSYNPNGIKPSTRLEPLQSAIFDKDPRSTRGPLTEKALVEPSAIYIVHYASRNEE